MQKIPWAKPSYWGNEKEYVLDALDSTWISGGKYIEILESEFENLFKVKNAAIVSNGTTALQLAFLCSGLSAGDEVIVPGFSFMAAANIALQFGAKPVFAEVNEGTWCVDPRDIERKISKKTKIIVPIHTYGNVCDLGTIIEIAEKRDILVIEDCAESLFSKYKNRFSGTFGEISTYSFHATKTIATGEGGMVVTDNDKFAELMKLYRSHGLKTRGDYNHIIPGGNFRITNLQAAIGVAQFEKKLEIIRKRKVIHELYKTRLGSIPGIKLQEFNPDVDPVLWAFSIELDEKAFPYGRDFVIGKLGEAGIETRPGFVASSLLSIYEKHSLPICENLSRKILSLPSFPTLTEEQLNFICDNLTLLKR